MSRLLSRGVVRAFRLPAIWVAVSRSDAPSLVALGLFSLAFYHQLTVGGRILASFDTLVYFYPNLTFLGTSLRAGQLPLWDPYIFAGVPFLANSQTGVFYPPNWLTALLPAPVVYSWSLALHAAIAAAGAFLFGRRALRLERAGALVVGLVFAFGGFFSAQVGHLNQLQAASWLPWLLLVGDSLLRQPRGWLVAAGAVLLALQVLAGHTQVVYLSVIALGLYVGLHLLASLLEQARAAKGLWALAGWAAPRLRALFLLGVLGAGLAAPQLLPTLELSRESIRAGGMDYADGTAFSLLPTKLLLALLPPFGGPAPFSEWVAYVGVVALLLAAAAVVLKLDRRVAVLLIVTLVALALALGKYNPVYPLAYRFMPGLDLFRVPARWLLLYAVALAGLAGVGLDSLLAFASGGWLALAKRKGKGEVPLSDSGGVPAGWWASGRGSLLRLGILVSLTLGAFALYRLTQQAYPLEKPPAITVVGLALAAGLGLALVLLCLASGRLGRARAAGPSALGALGVGLVAVELLVGSAPLDLNRTNLLAAFTEPPPEVAFLQQQAGLFRVLGVSENAFEVGQVDEIRSRLAGVLDADEIYDYLVATKHKETLTPNLPLAFGVASLDGYDGGVLPLKRFNALKTLFPEESRSVADGRIRAQVRNAPDAHLLGWLNVRYLILDRARDLWLDGAYYDTAVSRTVEPGGTLTLDGLAPLDSAAVGLVGHLEGADAPKGAEVATLVVRGADGSEQRLPIREGVETEEGKPEGTPALKGVAPWQNDPSGQEYAARLALPNGVRPVGVSVEYSWPTGKLVVRSLTLLGAKSGDWRVVDLSPDYRLDFLGDGKIYENRAVQPRAFVVGRVETAADEAAALETLRSPDFDPTSEAVVLGSDGAADQVAGSDPTPAAVVEYRPGHVVLESERPTTGLVVLTESVYPGWRAFVDGVEQPVLRVDYAFQGVVVPAGRHVVTFVFRPTSLTIGLAIATVAVIATLALSRWR